MSLLDTELPGESGGSSGTLSSSTEDILNQDLKIKCNVWNLFWFIKDFFFFLPFFPKIIMTGLSHYFLGLKLRPFRWSCGKLQHFQKTRKQSTFITVHWKKKSNFDINIIGFRIFIIKILRYWSPVFLLKI